VTDIQNFAQPFERDRRRVSRYEGLGFEAIIDGRVYRIADISSLGLRIVDEGEHKLPMIEQMDNVVFTIATTGRHRRTVFETFGYVVRRTSNDLAIRYYVGSRFWPRFLAALDRRRSVAVP
jgi:hypothetical protein